VLTYLYSERLPDDSNDFAATRVYLWKFAVLFDVPRVQCFVPRSCGDALYEEIVKLNKSRFVDMVERLYRYECFLPHLASTPAKLTVRLNRETASVPQPDALRVKAAEHCVNFWYRGVLRDL